MLGRRHVALAALAVAIVAPQSASAAPTQPGELVNPLVPPDNCVFCHDFDNPAPQIAEPAWSPVRTWTGTMMANASRDPVFWAGIGVANQDAPGETILCVRCHSPRAFLEGNGDATTIDELTVEQLYGVECEVCHRAMEDVGVPPGNAQYTIDDVFGVGVVPRRGPWDYTDGVEPPLHDWIYDPYISSSRLCGTCHDVTTPVERVDDMGMGLGTPFNEQRTYSEWLNSAYAQPPMQTTCQDCHLPEVPDIAGCFQNTAAGETHPAGGVRHDLLGANTFMLNLLKSEYGSAGTGDVQDIYYDTAIAQSANFLATAATLQVTGPADVDLTAGLSGLDVTVTNNTGHKLPSGYSEGRVMWLEVLAEYNGQRVYSSGAWDQMTGIEDDMQIRRYEAIAEEWATGTEFHLLLNNYWVVDNRIPPLGLTQDVDTDPVGNRYALQMDGTWPNFDTHAYTFGPDNVVFDETPEDDTDDELLVTVRLRYLINTPEYIDFLANSGTEAGMHVGMLFDTAGGAVPEILAEETLSLPIVAFGAEGPPPATSSGGASTGDSTATSGPSTTTGADGTTSGPMATTSATTTSPATSGDGSSGDDSSGDGGGDGDGGGCGGCRTGRPLPGAWLLLVGVGLLGRRRRRRPARRRGV